MGSEPHVLGYDVSDGPTKNKDGNFVNNKSQWIHTIKDDPKHIFSLTKRATDFITSSTKQQNHFIYKFLIMPFTRILNPKRAPMKGLKINPKVPIKKI